MLLQLLLIDLVFFLCYPLNLFLPTYKIIDIVYFLSRYCDFFFSNNKVCMALQQQQQQKYNAELIHPTLFMVFFIQTP